MVLNKAKIFLNMLFRFCFEEKLIKDTKEENFYEHNMEKNYLDKLLDYKQMVNQRILCMFLYLNNLILEMLISAFYKDSFSFNFLSGLLVINILSLILIIILVISYKRNFIKHNLFTSFMIGQFDLLFIYCLIYGFLILEFQDEFIFVNFYKMLSLNFFMALIINIMFHRKIFCNMKEIICIALYKIILFSVFLLFGIFTFLSVKNSIEAVRLSNFLIAPEIYNIIFYTILSFYFLLRRKLFFEESKRIINFKSEKCNYYQSLLNMLNKSFLSFNKSTYRINCNNSFINFLRKLGLSDEELNRALDRRDLDEYNRIQEKNHKKLEIKINEKNNEQINNLDKFQINSNNQNNSNYIEYNNGNDFSLNKIKETLEQETNSKIEVNKTEIQNSGNQDRLITYYKTNKIPSKFLNSNLDNKTMLSKNNIKYSSNNTINNTSQNILIQGNTNDKIINPNQINNNSYDYNQISRKNTKESKNNHIGNSENLFIKELDMKNIKENPQKINSSLSDNKINNKPFLININKLNSYKHNKIINFDDNTINSCNSMEDLFLMKLDFLLKEIFENFVESSNNLNKISIGDTSESTLSDYIRNIFYGLHFIDIEENFIHQGIFCCDINAMKKKKQLKIDNLNSNNIKNSKINTNIINLNCIEYEKETLSIEVYSRKISTPEGDLIEFYFNDITSISKIEKGKAEIKLKSLFLAKISHEFKTPLITIIYIMKNYISKEHYYISDESFSDNDFESLQIIPSKKEKYIVSENLSKDVGKIKISKDYSNLNHNSLSNTIKDINIFPVCSKKNNNDYINNIIDLSDYMLSLINDIIDFSVIDSSFEMKFQLDFFDLHKMLNFGFRILKILIDCKGLGRFIQPKIEIDKNVPQMFYSDEMRIKQVLLNLISNSIKFTRNGYIKIISKLVVKDLVEISIEDSGIGISSEDIKKLFIDYGKLKNEESAKLNKMGSGLGLSICKKIIAKLGTQIQVESQQNTKTRFYFGIFNKNTEKISDKSIVPKSFINSYKSNVNINNEIEKILNNSVVQELDNSNTKYNLKSKDNENIPIQINKAYDDFDYIFNKNKNYILDDQYQLLINSDKNNLDNLIDNYKSKTDNDLSIINERSIDSRFLDLSYRSNNNKEHKDNNNKSKLKSKSLSLRRIQSLLNEQMSSSKINGNIMRKFDFNIKKLNPIFLKPYSKTLSIISDNKRKKLTKNIFNEELDGILRYSENKKIKALSGKEMKIRRTSQISKEILNENQKENLINIKIKNGIDKDSIMFNQGNSMNNVSESIKNNFEENFIYNNYNKKVFTIGSQTSKYPSEFEDTILESPKQVFYIDVTNEKIITDEIKYFPKNLNNSGNLNEFNFTNDEIYKLQPGYSNRIENKNFIKFNNKSINMHVNNSYNYFNNIQIDNKYTYKYLEIEKNEIFSIFSSSSLNMKVRDSRLELFLKPIKKYFNKIMKYEKIVIIVDDNEIIRESIKRILKSVNKSEKKKISVICLGDGIELIYLVMMDQMMKNIIKIIISDEQMIYLNGSDCFRILNDMVLGKKINKIPFVFCSSNPDNSNQLNTIKSPDINSKGLDYFYLSKPPSKEQIKSTLDLYNI